MKFRIAALIFAIGLFSVITTPMHANAALFTGHIVPDSCQCDNQSVVGGTGTIGTAPDWGCVLATIQNLINFAVMLATVIFTIYLVLTGFSFITSGGSSEARSKAKTRFANVFIGLAVLLCAWLIIDFVMKSLLYDNAKFGPWNSLLSSNGHDNCIVAHQPTSITTGQLTTVVPSTAADPTTGGVGAAGSGTSKLDVQKAASAADANALPKSARLCARYVCKAIAAGGVNMGCANAYQLGSNLTSAGFTAVYTGTYNGSSFGAQKGDVVVFQRAPNQSKTQYGHTAIFDGTHWVSDFIQSTMGFTKYNGVSYTIYRP